MDISRIIADLKDCPCGREHTAPGMRVEIGPNLLEKTSELLGDFPRELLVVADRNTLAASEGIMEILAESGFSCTLKCYDDMRTANSEDVELIAALARGCGGVLSVGTGSLNDICRLASYEAGKPFAIFATAPSMDGFASNTAPITYANFKKSILCHAPTVIIGDTRILARSPALLKAAGFGDMIAKYVALTDWRIANLTDGEYHCPRVAAITKAGLEKVMALAGQVQEESPEAAAALMEGLVLTGLAMTLTNLTRPASGAEHVLAHFWEIKKLEQGKPSDFHGKKVGVATLMTAELYHKIARSDIRFHADATNWDAVYEAYGKNFVDDIKTLNDPTPTSNIDPAVLAEQWPQIKEIIKEELPPYEDLLALMQKAGAATTIEEIDIDPALADTGVKYHSYMRERINLSRLIPMMTVKGR
ncbi:MAG: sn-glycerol-1-phosphate dehydrogenase [Defluviitaleaceae bacterium]|nr:sn-glycerol-1-phosphate dehydrogenase [Defluviitaleaceae bacterium]